MILPKHKKLVTVGCSFTAGQNLTNPEKQSWPALLANKLNLECVNLGQNGASNDFINDIILKYFLGTNTEDCFLIVAYSELSRINFGCGNDDNKVVHLTANSRLWPDLAKMIYPEFSNDLYDLKKFLLNVMRTQSWLSTRNVDYVMLNGITQFRRKFLLDREIQFYCDQINQEKYLHLEDINFNAIIEDDGKFIDGHPNELGHQRIADTIYKWVTERS